MPSSVHFLAELSMPSVAELSMPNDALIGREAAAAIELQRHSRRLAATRQCAARRMEHGLAEAHLRASFSRRVAQEDEEELLAAAAMARAHHLSSPPDLLGERSSGRLSSCSHDSGVPPVLACLEDSESRRRRSSSDITTVVSSRERALSSPACDTDRLSGTEVRLSGTDACRGESTSEDWVRAAAALARAENLARHDSGGNSQASGSSPRPAPGVTEADCRLLLSCVKELNMTDWSASAMPGPVSETANRRWTCFVLVGGSSDGRTSYAVMYSQQSKHA